MGAIYWDTWDTGWHVEGEDLICMFDFLLEFLVSGRSWGDIHRDESSG